MIRDALGHTFELRSPPRRVVSLVPSLTETLFDLGAGEAVVGITDFCIFPERLDRPRVGGTKNPRVDAIRALAPDLVHMNLEENLERQARAIEQFAPVFVSEPKSVADVRSLIETLGVIHGRTDPARAFIARLDAESARPATLRFTFAVPIWKQPWMWCGADTYVSDLVVRAGGTNVVTELRYPALTLEEVTARLPEVVFLPDEPYAFTARDGVGLPGRVIGPFPGHLFTWHGTRTLQGLRFLHEVLS